MLTIKMLIVRLETARIPAPGARWGLSVVNFSGGSTVSAASRQDAILRLIPLKTANPVLGVLCLRIEHGVSWFASHQRLQEEQKHPTNQSTFFWTFLYQAILVIERARLRALAISNDD